MIANYFQPFFDHVSSMLRLASQAKESTIWIDVNPGDKTRACKRRKDGHAESKVPDRVSRWWDGRQCLVSEKHNAIAKPDETPCLLVGDYKRAKKFSHKQLTDAMASHKYDEVKWVMS